MPDRPRKPHPQTPHQADDARGAELEAAILALLAERAPGKTICPSEAAKLVGGTASPDDWRPLMEPVRAAAHRLVVAGKILITQHGEPVDLATAKGPIRLRLR